VDDHEPVVRQTPDVIVRRDANGDLAVEVADSQWFGVRLAAVPAAVRHDATAVSWLGTHQRDAKEFVRRLDVRAAVLRTVATVAVARQAGYFDLGPAGHVRLSRVDVATELGLHPSTVSRAVAGKILSCPDRSLIPFADLFGGAVAVKARIIELTAGRPMSDTELCAALSTAGFAVARRTVAKYRAQLAIPAGGLRRS
jgi:RNA polymerase sigma-54 factor